TGVAIDRVESTLGTTPRRRASVSKPRRRTNRSGHSALWHTGRVTTAPSRERALRRDAQRNRERIVASARTLFARDGIDASVEAISREAGVGMGTLYRHFPAKEDLVDAVLEDAFVQIVPLAEHAVAEEDPRPGP